MDYSLLYTPDQAAAYGSAGFLYDFSSNIPSAPSDFELNNPFAPSAAVADTGTPALSSVYSDPTTLNEGYSSSPYVSESIYQAFAKAAASVGSTIVGVVNSVKYPSAATRAGIQNPQSIYATPPLKSAGMPLILVAVIALVAVLLLRK